VLFGIIENDLIVCALALSYACITCDVNGDGVGIIDNRVINGACGGDSFEISATGASDAHAEIVSAVDKFVIRAYRNRGTVSAGGAHRNGDGGAVAQGNHECTAGYRAGGAGRVNNATAFGNGVAVGQRA